MYFMWLFVYSFQVLEAFLIFLKHPISIWAHFRYAKLVWSEIQTFAGLQRTSANNFPHTPCLGGGFLRVVSTWFAGSPEKEK